MVGDAESGQYRSQGYLLELKKLGTKNNLRRVDNPSNGVVDRLGFGKRLVSTLVANDPESGSE